jgi:excisionase family DNA binding protein
MSDMKDTVMTISTASPESRIDADSEILTVLDVAHFLRVPKSTVYKLARLRQLPASKIGKHWRFLRRDIREWMQKQSSQPL